jgi:hypothetical protein
VDTYVSSLLKSPMRALKKGSEKLKTSPTGAKKIAWLYFTPLLAIVLGVAFYVYGYIVFSWPNARYPYSPLDDVVWGSFQFFLVIGIIGSLITIPLYLVHRRARKA